MDRIEAAARRYCEIRGDDPERWDQRAGKRLQEWEFAYIKIRELQDMQQALKETE